MVLELPLGLLLVMPLGLLMVHPCPLVYWDHDCSNQQPVILVYPTYMYVPYTISLTGWCFSFSDTGQNWVGVALLHEPSDQSGLAAAAWYFTAIMTW